MKKALVLLALVFAFAWNAEAQLKYGIRAGVSSSQLKLSDAFDIATADDVTQELELEAKNAKVGFHFGGFAQVSFAGLFVQPELLISSTGGEVEVAGLLDDNGEVYSTIKRQSFTRLDVPVMVGMKFGPARIGLAPVASFTVHSKDEVKDILEDAYQEANGTEGAVEERLKTAAWSLQIGAGLDILNKVVLDVKYEFGLSMLGEGVTIDGNDFNFSQKANQFVFSIGINLGS